VEAGARATDVATEEAEADQAPRVVGALTDRQYQALEAVALKGIPMDVVAEQMGTNRNALYKLVHDARKKLRAHLDAQGLSIDYVMELFQK
jgi:RNA polymerase sigma-70 factor (ECF subfamily)